MCTPSAAVSLRKIVPQDYSQLLNWIVEDPELQFFERPETVEQLTAYFDEFENEVACIIEEGGCPVGYVEYYPSLLWAYVWGDQEDEHPWGMDVFIGRLQDRERGLGTRAVSLTVQRLMEDFGATRVVIDPEASNEPAIRCYENAGFRKTKLIPASVTDGGSFPDTWLMEWIDP